MKMKIDAGTLYLRFIENVSATMPHFDQHEERNGEILELLALLCETLDHVGARSSVETDFDVRKPPMMPERIHDGLRSYQGELKTVGPDDDAPVCHKCGSYAIALSRNAAWWCITCRTAVD